MAAKKFDEDQLATEFGKDGYECGKAGGFWWESKHNIVRRYIDMFTRSMFGKHELHYVDLFAGPGVWHVGDSPRWLLGSPLIAATRDQPFAALHLCDKEARNCEALDVRLGVVRKRQGRSYDYQIICADANQAVADVIDHIPQYGTLTLAFLDPYRLSLDFSTLQAIAQRRSDLVVYFPDHVNVLRNYRQNYWDNPDSPLDRVLGTPD